MVSTDLSVAIPEDCYGRVAPRSGLAWKHSIDTGAGVIDCDYRGPLKVILFNFSDTEFAVSLLPHFWYGRMVFQSFTPAVPLCR